MYTGDVPRSPASNSPGLQNASSTPSQAQTLTGEVTRITYESEESGFRVIRVEAKQRGVVTCVGKFPFVSAGASVSLSGEFIQDKKHGEQFRVHSLMVIDPDTLHGIEKYLGSGLIPGIGPKFAKRIVERFGLDTLKVLDEAPQRLGEIPGLGHKRREELKRRWSEQRALGNLTILLQTHGVGGQLARRILDRFAERAAEIVQQHPYRLALEVRGLGFKTADKIAAGLGISHTHPERAQAGVYHQLRLFVDQGHTHVGRRVLQEATAEMLQIDVGYVDAAIDKLWAQGKLVVDEEPTGQHLADSQLADGPAVYLSALHAAELSVVEQCQRLLSEPAPALLDVDQAIRDFERSTGIELAAQQRDAVEATADQKLVIVTGGPGVGKTTIIQAILRVFDRAKLTTLLAAPTGRAAKRLSEATGRGASTIHRLLEYDPKQRGFSRNEDNPVPAQAVIVDEASMIDLQLAQSLLCALPGSARLVVVGDSDQLPSVGPGAVLRDFIQSGLVRVVRLNEIFRQAGQSGIVSNAHRILAGQPPQGANSADDAGQQADFFVIERTSGEQAAETIAELVLNRIPKRFGFDPMTQIQVLSPMHRGPVGTIALNERLQAALNPSGPALERPGHTLRQGDRVLQLKNDYDRDVFNGDTGRIESVELQERQLTVRFDDRQVKLEDSALDQLALAYAVSIHKSQGSEYPAVVIPLLTSHFVMLSRNLLYTAVTRARKLCVLVADPKAISLAVSEIRKEERSTGLANRLRGLR